MTRKNLGEINTNNKMHPRDIKVTLFLQFRRQKNNPPLQNVF